MKRRAKWIHKTHPLKKGPAPLRLGVAEVLASAAPSLPLAPLQLSPRPFAPQNEMTALQLFPELYFSAVKLRDPSAQLSQPL